MDYMILISVFLPIIAGASLLLFPVKPGFGKATAYTVIVLIITAIAVTVTAFKGGEIKLFALMEGIDIAFRVDDISRIFSLMVIYIWLIAGIFSYDYMRHEGKHRRYYGFYLITVGVILGLDYSSNLVTMYLFYELMTIMSMPLVIHEESHEAVMAALKYLIYSFAGAYAALFGVFFLTHFCTTLDFTAGGSIDIQAVAENKGLFLIAVFAMLIGFGVKAGSFPMHAWLPTAHPLAPSPASAVLSGLIVKCGVLAIIRVVFYMVGPKALEGTWVQTVWIILSLITVFMGSMLAYREPVLKKRLAYSTVSQLSYILFGLAMLNSMAATGAILHVVFHAVIKTGLFLAAGAFISRTGKKKVSELKGIGKQMPISLLSYTFVSLGLIGIPPFSGFISKWYLANGALSVGGIFGWLGPVILLASALLTAGYLLPLTINGYLPGEDYKGDNENKENPWICGPLFVLALATLMMGILPGPLSDFIDEITMLWF